MTLTQEDLDMASRLGCLPITLLINFSLFQYLCTAYYRRRKEWLVRLLIACAFGGFATLIPLAEDDRKMVGHLNDISETCTTLTFVVQITMVGRYITRRVRIWSLRFMTFLAELLIAFGIFIVVLNVVDVATEHTLNLKAFDWMDNLMEDVSLGFIFVFRFYYIAMLRGFRHILETKKKELLLYLLFLTHEYPFMLLKDQTKLEWDDIQALWNRLTVMLCVIKTIQDRLRSTIRSGHSNDGNSRGHAGRRTRDARNRPGSVPTASNRSGRSDRSDRSNRSDRSADGIIDKNAASSVGVGAEFDGTGLEASTNQSFDDKPSAIMLTAATLFQELISKRDRASPFGRQTMRVMPHSPRPMMVPPSRSRSVREQILAHASTRSMGRRLDVD